MKRGFEAVLADLDRLAAKPLPDALKAIGTASGDEGRRRVGPSLRHVVHDARQGAAGCARSADVGRAALARRIEAVKARGKSDVGQKTMLDVLAPRAGRARAGGAELDLADLQAAAVAAAEATMPMKAMRGRASFLGERSIGHMDPGARSSALMIAAVCKRQLGG